MSRPEDTNQSCPIKVDDQLGATGRTGAHSVDRKTSSEALGRTRKTQWTTRTALRSCCTGSSPAGGAMLPGAQHCRGLAVSYVPSSSTADGATAGGAYF